METKFTKGEWITHITELPFTERAYVRAKNYKGWITLLETNWISNFEEQKANAKLIASAPDMLKALNNALSLINSIGCVQNMSFDEYFEVISIKNAIKKATK